MNDKRVFFRDRFFQSRLRVKLELVILALIIDLSILKAFLISFLGNKSLNIHQIFGGVINRSNDIIQNLVTYTINTGSLVILGNSKWNIDRIDPITTIQFPTEIVASKSLINSPVSFKVNIDCINNRQLISDTFSIGANVVGEIDVSINDLAVENIGES